MSASNVRMLPYPHHRLEAFVCCVDFKACAARLSKAHAELAGGFNRRRLAFGTVLLWTKHQTMMLRCVHGCTPLLCC